MKKISTNESKGITLIALVVTIIVLLILSGISISMLTDNNGILSRAMEAKEKTEVSALKERVKLDIFEKQLIGNGEITNDDLRAILDNYFTGVPSKLPESSEELEALELISKDGKYKVKVGEIYKGELSKDSGETEEPIIPEDPNEFKKGK